MFNLSRKPVLSPNAKNLIRHQDHYYTKVLIDSKGEPVNKEFEKVISPYEIRKELFGKIKKLGFKLQIVPPNKANCIIRVYQKSYFQENGKVSKYAGAFLRFPGKIPLFTENAPQGKRSVFSYSSGSRAKRTGPFFFSHSRRAG